jgi:hypothetical protein
MLRYMRRAGITSPMLYTAGMASVAISMASWLMSMRFEDDGRARADRWGIFVGEWAPTFFAMGIAMRLEEEWGEEQESERVGEMKRRAREAMPVP